MFILIFSMVMFKIVSTSVDKLPRKCSENEEDTLVAVDISKALNETVGNYFRSNALAQMNADNPLEREFAFLDDLYKVLYASEMNADKLSQLHQVLNRELEKNGQSMDIFLSGFGDLQRKQRIFCTNSAETVLNKRAKVVELFRFIHLFEKLTGFDRDSVTYKQVIDGLDRFELLAFTYHDSLWDGLVERSTIVNETDIEISGIELREKASSTQLGDDDRLNPIKFDDTKLLIEKKLRQYALEDGFGWYLIIPKEAFLALLGIILGLTLIRHYFFDPKNDIDDYEQAIKNMNRDQDTAMNAFNNVSNDMHQLWKSVQKEYGDINLAPELSSDLFCQLSHVNYYRQPAGILTPAGVVSFRDVYPRTNFSKLPLSSPSLKEILSTPPSDVFGSASFAVVAAPIITAFLNGFLLKAASQNEFGKSVVHILHYPEINNFLHVVISVCESFVVSCLESWITFWIYNHPQQLDESIEENQEAVRYIEDIAQKLLTERVTNGSTTIQTEIANLKKQLAQHLKLPEQTGEEASPLYPATIMFDGSGLDETTGAQQEACVEETSQASSSTQTFCDTLPTGFKIPIGSLSITQSINFGEGQLLKVTNKGELIGRVLIAQLQDFSRLIISVFNDGDQEFFGVRGVSDGSSQSKQNFALAARNGKLVVMLRPFDAGSTSVFPLLERSIGGTTSLFNLPSTAEISVYSQDMMAQDTKELLERVLNYNATTTGLSTDSIGIFGEVNGCYNTTKTWYGNTIRPWDFLLGPAYPSYNGQGPLSDQASIASENVLSSVYNELSLAI